MTAVAVKRSKDDPEPKAGEVRVRVGAAGINFADISALSTQGVNWLGIETLSEAGINYAGLQDLVYPVTFCPRQCFGLAGQQTFLGYWQ